MGDTNEAAYIAGLMNSAPIRCIAYLCASPKGGVPWRQFMAWNVGFVPIVGFDSKNRLCEDIVELAIRLSKNKDNQGSYPQELDGLVAQNYGISEKEVALLGQHLNLMKGHLKLDSSSKVLGVT